MEICHPKTTSIHISEYISWAYSMSGKWQCCSSNNQPCVFGGDTCCTLPVLSCNQRLSHASDQAIKELPSNCVTVSYHLAQCFHERTIETKVTETKKHSRKVMG